MNPSDLNTLLLIADDNALLTWGDNSYGQLSIPSDDVEARGRLVEVACGWAHSLLLTGTKYFSPY